MGTNNIITNIIKEKMENKTFILLLPRTYRRNLKLFIKEADGKIDRRTCEFKTEHLVREQDRTKRAKKVNAEFTTNNEKVYDALLRDPGYGITFILKGDKDLKLKREPIDVTPMDAEKIALRNLFGLHGLPFDSTKTNQVLRKEIEIHVATNSGVVKESPAAPIEHKPVDVQMSIGEQIESGIKKYEEETGNAFPAFELRTDTINFIDGLSNPKFDREAFIKGKVEPVSENEGDDLPDNLDDAKTMYHQLLGKNVAPAMSKNLDWINNKIKEKLAEQAG